MEDAHTTLLEVEDSDGTAFFAVYDGHGGPNVAKYSGEGLHKRIVGDAAFKRKEYRAAIKNGFLEMDRALKYDQEYAGDSSGCTAITATITKDNMLYVGNAGDSRAVLCRRGTAIALSRDHKPVNREEAGRIVAAGGFVEYGRVNGSLALSRALGDFEFKTNATLGPEDQIVTANPAIQEHQLDDEDEFIVLACDGIWDCMTSQEVITYVRKGIADKITLETLCENVMDKCLAPDSELTGVGCDNMTLMIVGFLNGQPIDHWYEKVAQRHAANPNPAEGIQVINGDEDPAAEEPQAPIPPPPKANASNNLTNNNNNNNDNTSKSPVESSDDEDEKNHKDNAKESKNNISQEQKTEATTKAPDAVAEKPPAKVEGAVAEATPLAAPQK
ncbi:Protein phosphatase 2C 2 [Actinomortierella ambigua]|uniref:protein-serine/threonine phosphatase n=1 Tax=Actinomortierella ambigua TaxID=1343610 RepID=A0A9P6TWX3_9FUNG|nr:Protein phosphatase 2C 2 [Actinomortierella ambigua]